MWNSAGDSVDADHPPDDALPADAGRPSGNENSARPVQSECPIAAGSDEDPVVAELAVEHRDIVLGDAIRAAPSVTVEPNYRTSDDRSSLLVFTVVGGSLDEFDEALATDHTVRDPLRIATTDDARAYRVRYAPDALRFTPFLTDLGALLYDARSSGRAWSFHVRFPSRTAFATFRDYCSTNGATLQLFRLYRDGAAADGGDLGLTDRQWETLAIAHEMGYFEVPRGTTQVELAGRLDVSPSAVSQRIRRATDQLLGEALESSQFGPRF